MDGEFHPNDDAVASLREMLIVEGQVRQLADDFAAAGYPTKVTPKGRQVRPNPHRHFQRKPAAEVPRQGTQTDLF